MKRIARTNQGGSAVTFAIIGAVLVLALAAGIYFAYQRGANIRSSAPIIGSTNQKTAPAPAPQKSSDQSKDKTDSSKTNSGPVNQADTDQQTGSSQSTATGEIPQTGPSNAAYLLMTVAVLAFVATLYVRSRTSLRSL